MRASVLGALLWLKNAALDQRDRLAGRRDPLIPPRNANFVGDGDYREVGDHFLQHFVELASLHPDESVLDVGSGTGRIARPLTRYLSARGRYVGMEINAAGVNWCRRNIAPRFPNFEFVHADLYNKMYNPSAKPTSADYRFPFDDGAFDFAFATSVFTHMFPRDVEHYLAEITRVLRPGGRLFSTYFLVSSETSASLAEGRSALDFKHVRDDYVTTSEAVPETAIGFREDDVRRMHDLAGLDVVEPIHYGWWSGRTGCKSFQDIVLSRRTP